MSGKQLIIYTDGAAEPNPGPAAIGVFIVDGAGRVIAEISEAIGHATNNQAEYRALIAGLKEAKRLGAEHVDIKLDSELVVRQVRGEYRVKNPALKPLFEQARHLMGKFQSSRIQHIPREQNRAADALSRRPLKPT